MRSGIESAFKCSFQSHDLKFFLTSCEFCIVNHYLDAYSANPPALREDPTRADAASRRGPGTDAVEVMCMFDAGDGEKARKCMAMAT